jgi:hypothetical protein
MELMRTMPVLGYTNIFPVRKLLQAYCAMLQRRFFSQCECAAIQASSGLRYDKVTRSTLALESFSLVCKFLPSSELVRSDTACARRSGSQPYLCFEKVGHILSSLQDCQVLDQINLGLLFQACLTTRSSPRGRTVPSPNGIICKTALATSTKAKLLSIL